MATESAAASGAVSIPSPSPIPWPTLAWGDLLAPLEIDVGCHRGTFLVGMAERYPQIRFLGVERQRHRVERCQRKIERLGLANAQVRQGDGLVEAATILVPHSVETIHVSFPDPWPKRRHHVRRLVSAAFLHQAWTLLRPGGTLRLMTDDEPYFLAMSAAAGEVTDRFRAVEWADDRDVPMTEFQRKFAAQGKRPYQMALMACPASNSS